MRDALFYCLCNLPPISDICVDSLTWPTHIKLSPIMDNVCEHTHVVRSGWGTNTDSHLFYTYEPKSGPEGPPVDRLPS